MLDEQEPRWIVLGWDIQQWRAGAHRTETGQAHYLPGESQLEQAQLAVGCPGVPGIQTQMPSAGIPNLGKRSQLVAVVSNFMLPFRGLGGLKLVQGSFCVVISFSIANDSPGIMGIVGIRNVTMA